MLVEYNVITFTILREQLKASSMRSKIVIVKLVYFYLLI